MDSDDTIIIVLAGTFFGFVTAGHSRLKNGVASLAYGPGHPRSNVWKFAKTWMSATSNLGPPPTRDDIANR
jgi:hypothetical protein